MVSINQDCPLYKLATTNQGITTGSIECSYDCKCYQDANVRGYYMHTENVDTKLINLAIADEGYGIVLHLLCLYGTTDLDAFLTIVTTILDKKDICTKCWEEYYVFLKSTWRGQTMWAYDTYYHYYTLNISDILKWVGTQSNPIKYTNTIVALLNEVLPNTSDPLLYDHLVFKDIFFLLTKVLVKSQQLETHITSLIKMVDKHTRNGYPPICTPDHASTIMNIIENHPTMNYLRFYYGLLLLVETYDAENVKKVTEYAFASMDHDTQTTFYHNVYTKLSPQLKILLDSIYYSPLNSGIAPTLRKYELL